MTGARSTSCPNLTVKWLVGVEIWGEGEKWVIEHLQNYLFLTCKRIRLKIVIFLFYDLPASNKKAENLPLATTLIVHLRSQFNHVFAQLISVLRFQSINFDNKPKITLCPSYKEGGMPQFCTYYSMLIILSLRPKRGPWPNGPPKKTIHPCFRGLGPNDSWL